MGGTDQHLIITCADARYGEFLIKHWLKSLKGNVRLDGIDVAVIDYGLSDAQRALLHDADVQTMRATADGNITNIRYRDIAEFLKERTYDQVMAVDGGDLIFQSDVSPLFEEHKDSFRGVCEQRDVPFHDLLLPTTDMSREDYRKIFDFLHGKQTVNGGVILGPADRFGSLWESFDSLCNSLDVFGTDQLVINYLFYQDGFVELAKKYNFVIMTTTTPFTIQNGQFYNEADELIPIVHNAGMSSATRCVANFGYGPEYNRRKWVTPFVLHSLFATMNFGKRLTKRLSLTNTTRSA